MTLHPKIPLVSVIGAMVLGWSFDAPAQSQRLMQELQAEGVWAGWRNGRVEPSGTFTGSPRSEQLTEWARQRREEFAWRTDDPVQGCGQPGMPRTLHVISPMKFSFIEDRLMVVRYESFDIARLVHFGREPQPGQVRTPDGYSNAHWEGDVLVVRTTHMDSRPQDFNGTPKTEDSEITERYYLREEAGRPVLRVDMTLEDPNVFVEPHVWNLEFVRMPEWELMEYACEERALEVAPGGAPLSGPTTFEGLDADGDGTLTLHEFSAYPPASAAGRTPDGPFSVLDADGDNVLSLYEFAHRRGPRFAGVDADSDGFLSLAEFSSLDSLMLGGIALDQLDDNGDQRLSVEEWARSGPRWESLEAE